MNNAIKYLGVVVLIIGVGVLGLLAYQSTKLPLSEDLLISNQTDTSVTLVFRTNTSAMPSVSLLGAESERGEVKFYDDRNVVEDTDGNRVLEKRDKYRTHHITLTGLKPESEYNIRIDGVKQEEGQEVTSVSTLATSDELNVPDPIYGKVEGGSSNTIVMVTVVDENEEEITKVLTTPLAQNNSYSFDVANARDFEGNVIERSEISGEKIRFYGNDDFQHVAPANQDQPVETLTTTEEGNSGGLFELLFTSENVGSTIGDCASEKNRQICAIFYDNSDLYCNDQRNEPNNIVLCSDGRENGIEINLLALDRSEYDITLADEHTASTTAVGSESYPDAYVEGSRDELFEDEDTIEGPGFNPSQERTDSIPSGEWDDDSMGNSEPFEAPTENESGFDGSFSNDDALIVSDVDSLEGTNRGNSNLELQSWLSSIGLNSATDGVDYMGIPQSNSQNIIRVRNDFSWQPAFKDIGDLTYFGCPENGALVWDNYDIQNNVYPSSLTCVRKRVQLNPNIAWKSIDKSSFLNYSFGDDSLRSSLKNNREVDSNEEVVTFDIFVDANNNLEIGCRNTTEVLVLRDVDGQNVASCLAPEIAAQLDTENPQISNSTSEKGEKPIAQEEEYAAILGTPAANSLIFNEAIKSGGGWDFSESKTGRLVKAVRDGEMENIIEKCVGMEFSIVEFENCTKISSTTETEILAFLLVTSAETATNISEGLVSAMLLSSTGPYKIIRVTATEKAFLFTLNAFLEENCADRGSEEAWEDCYINTVLGSNVALNSISNFGNTSWDWFVKASHSIVIAVGNSLPQDYSAGIGLVSSESGLPVTNAGLEVEIGFGTLEANTFSGINWTPAQVQQATEVGVTSECEVNDPSQTENCLNAQSSAPSFLERARETLASLFGNEVSAQSGNQGPGSYNLEVQGFTVTTQNVKIVDFDDNGNPLVVFFQDTNQNGLRDLDEPIITDIEPTQISIEKQANGEEFRVEEGWNLVGLPILPQVAEERRASGYLQAMNEQGVVATQIATFRDGKWRLLTFRRDTNEALGDDFEMIPGEGYFIRSYSTSSYVVVGNPYTESIGVDLIGGWNLINVVSPGTNYDSVGLMDAISDGGVAANLVSNYSNGAYQNNVKQDGVTYGTKFEINDKKGYFVRVEEGSKGTFTP